MYCSIPGFPVFHYLLEFAQLMSNESLMPSNHLILCYSGPLALKLYQHQSFLMSWLFTSGGQSIGASTSVLPMNIQCWFPLGLTDLISLLSKGLSRVFSNTTVWKHQFPSTHPSLHPTLISIHDYWKNHSLDYTDLWSVYGLYGPSLCQQSDVSAF